MLYFNTLDKNSWINQFDDSQLNPVDISIFINAGSDYNHYEYQRHQLFDLIKGREKQFQFSPVPLFDKHIKELHIRNIGKSRYRATFFKENIAYDNCISVGNIRLYKGEKQYGCEYSTKTPEPFFAGIYFIYGIDSDKKVHGVYLITDDKYAIGYYFSNTACDIVNHAWSKYYLRIGKYPLEYGCAPTTSSVSRLTIVERDGSYYDNINMNVDKFDLRLVEGGGKYWFESTFKPDSDFIVGNKVTLSTINSEPNKNHDIFTTLFGTGGFTQTLFTVPEVFEIKNRVIPHNRDSSKLDIEYYIKDIREGYGDIYPLEVNNTGSINVEKGSCYEVQKDKIIFKIPLYDVGSDDKSNYKNSKPNYRAGLILELRKQGVLFSFINEIKDMADVNEHIYYEAIGKVLYGNLNDLAYLKPSINEEDEGGKDDEV